MGFKYNMVNFGRGILQVVIAAVVAIIFLCLAIFVLKGYFDANALPLELEYEDWTDLFISRMILACIVSIVLNALYLFLAAFVNGPFTKISGWVTELFISIMAGAGLAVWFTLAAPEDSSCIVIADAMFILVFLLSFFVGSFFTGKFWKFDYNPILAFFNRRA